MKIGLAARPDVLLSKLVAMSIFQGSCRTLSTLSARPCRIGRELTLNKMDLAYRLDDAGLGCRYHSIEGIICRKDIVTFCFPSPLFPFRFLYHRRRLGLLGPLASYRSFAI